MIKQLEDNDVFEAIQLMNKSTKENTYGGYERNEAVWISFFLDIVAKQKENNPHYLAIGEYSENTAVHSGEVSFKKLRGFLLATTFKSYYNDNIIMDVKDCIVDSSCSSPFVVTKLYDTMLQHVKTHGGHRWRADSIRAQEHSKNYVELLKLKYGAEIYYSAHGTLKETANE